jgi:hypothetical protein
VKRLTKPFLGLKYSMITMVMFSLGRNKEKQEKIVGCEKKKSKEVAASITIRSLIMNHLRNNIYYYKLQFEARNLFKSLLSINKASTKYKYKSNKKWIYFDFFVNDVIPIAFE